jgi:hypothetical protein
LVGPLLKVRKAVRLPARTLKLHKQQGEKDNITIVLWYYALMSRVWNFQGNQKIFDAFHLNIQVTALCNEKMD